jgi:hypothetical protein
MSWFRGRLVETKGLVRKELPAHSEEGGEQGEARMCQRPQVSCVWTGGLHIQDNDTEG